MDPIWRKGHHKVKRPPHLELTFFITFLAFVWEGVEGWVSPSCGRLCFIAAYCMYK